MYAELIKEITNIEVGQTEENTNINKVINKTNIQKLPKTGM